MRPDVSEREMCFTNLGHAKQPLSKCWQGSIQGPADSFVVARGALARHQDEPSEH